MKVIDPSRAVCWVTALALSGVGLACKRGSEEATASPKAPPVIVGQENVARVQKEEIRSGPRVSGSLEAQQQSKVRAEAAGSIVQLNTDIGQPVTARQVLARIEEKSLRDSFVSAESSLRASQRDLELAEKQLGRIRRLVEAGAVADRDLEVAETTVEASKARVDDARARLAAASKQLDATVVRSPISGIVSERQVGQGDVVAPGALLFTIIDPSSMRLEASVPSEALGSLSVGKPVIFMVRGYPDQTFEGKIEQIAPAADPVTRQIRIYVSIPNPSGKLVAGLFAEGRISAETRTGLVVPAAAVDLTGPVPTVVRVREGRAERVAVEIGIRDEQTERVEIVKGIAEGDVLLVGAARTVANGTPIELPRAAGPAS